MGYDKFYRKVIFRKGTGFYQFTVHTLTFTPVAVGTASVPEQTTAVSGLTTSDLILAINPSGTAGSPLAVVATRVLSAGVIAIRFVNPTAASVTPTAGTFKVITIRT